MIPCLPYNHVTTLTADVLPLIETVLTASVGNIEFTTAMYTNNANYSWVINAPQGKVCILPLSLR